MSFGSASIGVTGGRESAGELEDESLSSFTRPYSTASWWVSSRLSLNKSASFRGKSGDGVGGSKSGNITV